jgi:hypothetical protein
VVGQPVQHCGGSFSSAALPGAQRKLHAVSDLVTEITEEQCDSIAPKEGLMSWSTAGTTWVALLGSLLKFAVPFVVQLTAGLPEPWLGLIGAGVALATALGVYHALYAPTGGGTPSPDGERGSSWPRSSC